jgi:Domain of unknown function (DUF382)
MQATDEGGANGEENASQAKNVDTSTHEDDSAAEPEVSRKKKKKLARMTVTDLKKQVKRPEVVEVHDVTSADPLTLVHLKAYRSTVPVPRHWCLKRRYLQVDSTRCVFGEPVRLVVIVGFFLGNRASAASKSHRLSCQST